jgi:hypothetical protein
MTAQLVFYVGFGLILVMFICFRRFFNPTPNMETFKQSGSQEAAANILKQWGAAGQRLAHRNLTFDWFFIPVYSTTWIAGAVYFSTQLPSPFHILPWIAGAIGLFGTACDVTENLCLLKMLDGRASDATIRKCGRAYALNARSFVTAGVSFLVAIVASCLT